MKSGINIKLSNSATVKARPDLDSTGVYVLVEDRGNTILLRMNKQHAGMLKDFLNALDLVTGL